MKRFSEQLKKQSTSIKLRGDERADLRDRLVTYMEYHPLPAEMRTEQKAPAAKALISDPFTTISVNWSIVRGFVGSFAVIAIVVLPMMAERSAPGDVLYPIKVELSEELRSTLALTPEKKIEWETTRLERRIAEARVLASEGRLSDEVEAEVAAAVKEQSQKTKSEIAKLRTTDEAEAAFAEIALASMLEVQNELLEQTIGAPEAGEAVADEDAQPAQGAGLAEAVAGEISTALSDAPARLTTDQLLAKIEEEATRAQELYQSVGEYATSEEEIAIGRRLADIDRRVQTAQAMLMPTVEVVADESDADTTESEADGEGEAVASSTDTSESADVSTTSEDNTDEMVEVVEADEVVADEPVTETLEVTEAVRAEAKALLQGALKDLRKLISFMSDIDARESVDVETIVPVVPTDEELEADVLERLSDVEAGYEKLSLEVEERVIPEKADIGLTELESKITNVNTALGTPDYVSAKEALAQAEALLFDLRNMIFVDEEPVVPEVPVAEEASSVEVVDGDAVASSTTGSSEATTTPETADDGDVSTVE